MNDFLNRHRSHIVGTLSGYDRIIFRGTLRSLSYQAGFDKFLGAAGILLKDFGRTAQGWTAQIAAHAERLAADAQRPYMYLSSASVRKDELARSIARRDRIGKGLVCVLACVEPCMTYDIRRNRPRRCLELVRRERKCRFFYFYFQDPEFGLMHVRLQSWVPFDIQVYINGREYLARQLDRRGIRYVRRDNAILDVANLPLAQRLLDRLESLLWGNVLAPLAARVNPLLGTVLRRVHPYYWATREAEYATDIVFRKRSDLQAIYPALVAHATLRFGAEDVLRFLGSCRPGRAGGEIRSETRRQAQGIRVKHWVRTNSIKMYDKAERVLRIETTINDPRQFRVFRPASGEAPYEARWRWMRKGVCDFGRLAAVAKLANDRYLTALSAVADETASYRVLDTVSHPVRRDERPVRALRPIAPDDARVFAAVSRGEHHIHGFRNRDLQARLFTTPPVDDKERRRRSSRVGRLLRLLRAHALIQKLPQCRRYRLTAHGALVMGTALAFRDDRLKILAA